MALIESSGPQLSRERIAALEMKLGMSLPPEYAKFLMHTNGGRPDPNVVDIVGLVDSPSDVQALFGIGLGINTYNIEWYFDEIRSALPSGVVPIGCDSGGGLYCVVAKGGNVGSVVYLDMTQAPPVQYGVARSFGAFLDKLRDEP